LTKLFTVCVRVEHREPRLRRPERHLLTAKRHARAEERVLERILLLCDLGGDDAGLAGLPQPVQTLVLVAAGRLGLVQRVELLAREEIAIPRNDRGLLGD